MGLALPPGVTLEEARSHLQYDAGDGQFTRLTGQTAGGKVGRADGKGYIQIGLCGRRYMAHRIAWWLHHGVWPHDQIDHLNGDKADNRIVNLEVVNQTTNLLRRGRRKDNASGTTGVSKHKATGKWAAYICIDKKQRHLGLFARKADAVASREVALAKWGLT